MTTFTDIEAHRAEIRGDGLIDSAFLAGGLDIHVSLVLPLEPTDAQVARRIVRHGFASARRTKGEAIYFADSLGDVGPLPGDDLHAMQIGNVLHVSRQGFDRLRGNIEARRTGVRRGV